MQPWARHRKGSKAAKSPTLLLSEPDFVEALTSSGKVRAGDRPMIGHVGVGLGIA